MLSRSIMENVLIIGSGLTGAVTAALLRSELPDKTAVSVWDKARGAGGRMSTHRSPDDPRCTVDLGAQYISATVEDYKHHQEIYEDLERCKLLQPMTGIVEGDDRHSSDTQHFVATTGVSSIVKHLFKKSGASTDFAHQVNEIAQDGDRWRVMTTDGQHDTCDCLVITMPTPQILALQGDIKTLIASQEDVKRKLMRVSYSARFALGVFYPPGTSIDVPWCAKYVTDDPVIRFIAIDSKKRDQEGSGVGPSIAVHASVPFSLKHLEETAEQVCLDYLLPHLKQLLPQLPQHAAIKPHKWRYSQVHHGYEGSPGAVLLQSKPLLILAGDGFTRSRFDGCVDSAMAVVDIIKQNIKLQQV